MEADADALDREVAAAGGLRGDRVDRVRAALDREPSGGVEVERDAEAARHVVGLPARDQGELGLVARRVRRGVERAVAAQQDDAALGGGEDERELVERRGDERLDARAGRAEKPRGVLNELRMPVEAARVPIRHEKQVRRERPQAPVRPRGRDGREGLAARELVLRRSLIHQKVSFGASTGNAALTRSVVRLSAPSR